MTRTVSHLWPRHASAILLIVAAMGLSACKTQDSAVDASPATVPSVSTQPAPGHSPVASATPVVRYASPEDAKKKHLRAEAHDLMLVLTDKESDLDKILIIKSPRLETVQIVKEITAMNLELHAILKKQAESDPSLKLSHPALPEPEIKTREGIESMIRDQLIWASGSNMERRLLLTQVDAMGYLSHLTEVASKYETIPKEAQYLKDVSDKASKLRERVIAALATLK